jgi:hypothetical protein
MDRIRNTCVSLFFTAFFLLAITQEIRAQDSAIEAWARWAVSQGKWKGQTVPYPEQEIRPKNDEWEVKSWLYPVCVHAPRYLPFAQVQTTLRALERAYALLVETGWPEPFADGGYGGTAFFDLYLTTATPLSAAAYADAPVFWSLFDAVSAFAVLDATISEQRLDACVVDALVQAILLGQDPAEAPSWRRATSAYVAYLATGLFGCDDDVEMKQQNPWQAWISDSAQYSSGGALFLAILSEREDGGTGTFIRELWQFARQTSGDVPRLRGSPDLWEALNRALSNSGQSLEDVVDDIAVARYFAGSQQHARFSSFRSLRSLREDGQVPVIGPIPMAQLPKRLPVSDPSLEVFGSSYTVVDTTQASFPSQLKIWLRGEYGARWSLVAIRLSSDGRELGRMKAPVRKDPNSYLTLELTEGTSQVVVVVTHLSERIPDADYDTRDEKAFQLILDKSESPVETVPMTIRVE